MAKILLGVCGGISAYKSCELVREFQRRDAEVRVIMTAAAQQFVTKLTFESLTRAPVYTDLFGDGAFGTAHIEIVRWADLLVVAPATANSLAHFAHGDAPDFLSTAYLAFRGPVVLAPAMNTAMWNHSAVRENLESLGRRDCNIVWPIEGELACGEIGQGKMAEPITIADSVMKLLRKRESMKGVRVIVTAGPTREYLDPVRFLSSPSSGKMGLAVAREAATRGADVTVVHGPLSARPDFSATFVPVTSAEEMKARVEAALPADVFIGTAAVADYRPKKAASSKIKRSSKFLSVTLVPTPDILSLAVARRRPGDLVVGFAAETERVVEHAREKLRSKNVDLIVANEVEGEAKGFLQDRTSVAFVNSEQSETWQNVTKDAVARALWDRIEKMRTKKETSHAGRREHSRSKSRASRIETARA
ncbi:MAG TPA: bifunctional phosphopantothenoylcysteine decarboxylase/phosphopantothenate--cysteine ligase CoaBC [Bdellovibrionota bacterium]|nr:bifunctional phosphopantothenoylcysteine decarboxylase/phosphopantothenate--cysteine ligase CoaBC [Bdellovibrionota bacterium]